jgi:RNA polymerase sigma-70 factor (ECF subfamily)
MNQTYAVSYPVQSPIRTQRWVKHERSTPDLESSSDEALMAATVQGNQAAFAVLVARHQSDLFRFCMSLLKNPERARDATQDAFLKAFSKADTFDTTRSFRPWFFRVARNLCLNMLERDRLVAMSSLQDPAYSAFGEDGQAWESEGPDPASQALEDERNQQLLRAMERLPERDREIVQLRFFQNLCARDIATIVGSTEGAVRTKLHRTLKVLRGSLALYME